MIEWLEHPEQVLPEDAETVWWLNVKMPSCCLATHEPQGGLHNCRRAHVAACCSLFMFHGAQISAELRVIGDSALKTDQLSLAVQ